MALSFDGKPMPDEYWRWRLALDTGWTLDYIDGLSLKDFHDYLQVMDAIGNFRRSWNG